MMPSLAIRIGTIALLLLAPLCGCASSYVTPGGPAPIGDMTPASIGNALKVMPEAPMPANVVYARVQAAGYRNYGGYGVDRGNFSLVGADDLERPEDAAALAGWPNVRGMARLSPILVPSGVETMRAMREGAAKLRADVLALYTVDTQFHVDDRDPGPLGLLTLGLAPTRTAVVGATISIAFFDVRSGFCYGVTEASARDDQLANAWTSSDAVDQCRRRVERKAFEKLLPDARKTWEGIATQRMAQLAEAR